MHTRSGITALTAAALLAVTSCSSDRDGKEPTPAPPTSQRRGAGDAKDNQAAPSDARAALEKAVRDYTAAYFKPDVDAGYAMLSAHCKEETNKEAFSVLLERAYGANTDREQYKVKRFSVDQLSGDMARVTYGMGLPKFDHKQEPWVRENGEWRYDAC